MSVNLQEAEYSLHVPASESTLSGGRKFRSCARPAVAAREVIAALVSIVLCTAAVWFAIEQDANIHSLSYHIDTLQSQIRDINTTNLGLTAEVDKLSEPTRILNVAVGQLHMQFAAPVRISADPNSVHR